MRRWRLFVMRLAPTPSSALRHEDFFAPILLLKPPAWPSFVSLRICPRTASFPGRAGAIRSPFKSNDMTPRKDQRKVNRHAGPHDRANGGGSGLAAVNGHGPASTERRAIPEQRDRPASDDASGITGGRDASSILVSATVRQSCSEVAPPPP